MFIDKIVLQIDNLLLVLVLLLRENVIFPMSKY